jgi:hypothetical protein
MSGVEPPDDGPRLPWDVLATPIEARKLARLGYDRGRVRLQPAFFRQLGDNYDAVAEATCPLRDHDAPDADCSCGFYAVADDTQLWRLGADLPNLAVLDVELAGRLIEHQHGYRASHQRTLTVRLPGSCTRCGKPAEMLHHQRFGAIVPACSGCARRPITLDAVSDALGVPVTFADAQPAPAPRKRRLEFVAAQMIIPVLLLFITAVVAFATASTIPLAVGQLGIVAWLVTSSSTMRPLAERLDIAPHESARLRHRWSGLVATIAISCDVLLAIVVVALRGTAGT